MAGEMTCPHCGNQVPSGHFCGACGGHLLEEGHRGRGRHFAYAARPGEHILHLSIVSTLFPHLPRRRSVPFQIALLLGTIVLLLFGYLRLTGPEIAAASLIVPLLYLVYLYEVEVYEDEPVPAVALTFGAGMVIGIPWAYFTGHLVTETLARDQVLGLSSSDVLLIGVLLPIVAQLLMLVGPVILFLRRGFSEALDGFTFGVAAALGFTLVTNFVDLWPQLQLGLQSTAPALDNTVTVIDRGLLIPFVNASTVGLIAAALWLTRGRTRTLSRHDWTTLLIVIVPVVLALRVALGLTDILVIHPETQLLIYLAVAGILLIMVRVALHHMLLAEAAEVRIGEPIACVHCHHLVPRMAFCPSCGVATRATSKIGPGRLNRSAARR